MKYYYDDPLQAAWMAREFGFKFCNHGADFGLKVFFLAGEYGYSYDQWVIKETHDHFKHVNLRRFSLHPDSYELLKPQEGDLLRIDEGSTPRYVTFIFQEDDELFFSNGEEYLHGIKEYKSYEDVIKIIQRNGKAFFMPKVEE